MNGPLPIFSAALADFRNTRPGNPHYQVIARRPTGKYTHCTVVVYADGSWRYTDGNFMYTSKQAAYRAVRRLAAQAVALAEEI